MYQYNNKNYKNSDSLYKAILKDSGFQEPTVKQLNSFSPNFLKENKFLFVIKESLKNNVRTQTYSNGAIVTEDIFETRKNKASQIFKEVFPKISEDLYESNVDSKGVAVIKVVCEELIHSVILSDTMLMAQTTAKNDNKMFISFICSPIEAITNICKILKSK